jgi:hypothetical protein
VLAGRCLIGIPFDECCLDRIGRIVQVFAI